MASLSPLAARCFFLVVVAVAAAIPGKAADDPQLKLRGAEALIAEWPTPSSSPWRGTETTTPHTGSHRFRDELADFRRVLSTLSEAEAAETWLHLFDTFFQRSSPSAPYLLRQREDLPDFPAVLAALPPVNAWPRLALAIKQRPLDAKSPRINDLMLKLLGARLTNDGDEQIRIQNQVRAFLKSDRSQNLSSVFEDSLERESQDPALALDNFTQVIDAASTPPQKRQSYVPPAKAPDLVGLLGLEKAKPLVVKALLSSIPRVNFDRGKSTRRLAETCAVEQIDQLVVPRWYLAKRLGSPALFEALEKRFGTPREKTSKGPLLTETSEEEFTSSVLSEYKDAYGYHILNLVVAGRQSEAVERALATQAPQSEDLLQSGAELLADRGHSDEVAEFLHGILTKKPELPWWGTYVKIAAQAGQSSEALAALRAAITAPNLLPSQKQTLTSYLAGALLADDQVDAGVAELQRTLASAASDDGAAEKQRDLRQEVATKLLKLGTALDQTAWVDIAASYLVASNGAEKYYWREERIAEYLVQAKRYRDAETVLAARLKLQLQNNDSRGVSSASSDVVSLLISLIHLYQVSGYNSDVLALLDRVPFWGRADLRQIEAYSDRATLYCAVASALLETGAVDRAGPLLSYVMKEERGLDQGYELWFKTAPTEVEKQLDVLAADDPFEERPLIWKADYLRRSGRLDEAEKACRAAIVIDPSDGEQPAGDRLRVYAVLAEIREGQGDVEQAKTYRRVVQAIRLAERADQLFQAGLLKRAIALYNEALSLFSDAYCIQSRLAIRLAESGRMQEAEEHYRRAYELMPDSFGRVESHCFGCEHAFGPEKAQNIAERVFAQFIERNPKKPQVHYLLGYLRSEQDRPEEALTHYREATRLDPDYLNAWKKISDLDDETALSADDLDLSVQSILRLDPRGRHDLPPVNKVHDLKILFRQADNLNPSVYQPASVYPLKASAALTPKASNEESLSRSEPHQGITREDIVTRHPFFETLTSLARFSNHSSEEP